MKQLLIAERFCLIAHVLSMAFGLAGLLLILPRPELVMSLPPAGQTLFQWGMAGGGVVYIIFGAAAVVSIPCGRWVWVQLWVFYCLLCFCP